MRRLIPAGVALAMTIGGGGSLFYMLFVTQSYPRYVPVAATFIGCIGAVWLWDELKDWRGTST